MSQRWARATLATYRTLGAGVYPFIGSYVRWRAARGKEDPIRRRERYGVTTVARPSGPLIWAHAVSVGETVAISPLLESLADDGLNIVLTTGTVTSAKMVSDRLSGRLIHQYVPLDLQPAISKFLNHWKPDLAIIAESEIWPMTILELGARRIPQVVVNGRLSDRSFQSWMRRLSLAEALMENLAHVAAQSDVDGERFLELGARPVTITGNLKADVPPPPDLPDDRMALQAAIGTRPTWVAVSTHEGEEIISAFVHQAIAQKINGKLLSIIVPRHPDRANDIRTMLESKNLMVAQRSRGERITPQTDVYLGDTIGEMGLYLRLANVAFVGNSMTGSGGQNPLEPAMLGAAVVSGRNVQNFREAYQKLIRAGAAVLVADPEALTNAVGRLLIDPQRRATMGDAGLKTVNDMSGALQKTRQVLAPHVAPLILNARLNMARGKG
jgi:3-deoxy-D-manno-octulosonic-acid transferase